MNCLTVNIISYISVDFVRVLYKISRRSRDRRRNFTYMDEEKIVLTGRHFIYRFDPDLLLDRSEGKRIVIYGTAGSGMSRTCLELMRRRDEEVGWNTAATWHGSDSEEAETPSSGCS